MPEDACRNRTTRFSNSEREELRCATLPHETPTAEFLRETILALARNPERGVSGALIPSFAPLIERMFRCTSFLTTEKCVSRPLSFHRETAYAVPDLRALTSPVVSQREVTSTASAAPLEQDPGLLALDHAG